MNTNGPTVADTPALPIPVVAMVRQMPDGRWTSGYYTRDHKWSIFIVHASEVEAMIHAAAHNRRTGAWDS